MKNILLPHPRKMSRAAGAEDIDVVLADSVRLLEVCYEPIGLYSGGKAMAHVQIEGEDPLRFFVKKNGDIVINPKIISKSDKYKHVEGCMSFPFRKSKKVARFKIIEVEYILSKVGEKININNIIKEKVAGIDAAIFQHEIGHFNLDLIY